MYLVLHSVNPFFFCKNGSLILKQLVLILICVQKYQYLFSSNPLNLESLKQTYIHQITHFEANLFKIENKITRYSDYRSVFSFDLLLVDFLVQLSIFGMILCESFLFGKNGSSTLKQLVVITLMIQKYLCLFSSHPLNLGSPQMTKIPQKA